MTTNMMLFILYIFPNLNVCALYHTSMFSVGKLICLKLNLIRKNILLVFLTGVSFS